MSDKNKGRVQSSLGIIIDRLNVPVVLLANYLHVDASLVSKWKNGQRCLPITSEHFENIIVFFTDDKACEDLKFRLTKLLKEFYPLENIESCHDLRHVLRNFLLERSCNTLSPDIVDASNADSIAKVLIYDESIGRRNAVFDVLELADQMSEPGKIIFIECEEYRWLLEDEKYAKEWRNKLYALLDRGFKARFILHFTIYHEKFFKFFRICNHLLFHRNIDWYYHEYYDEDVHWFSFFILEHTRSVMGFSMSEEQCDTTVFTDIRSIAQHKRVADMVMRSSKPLFTDFPTSKMLPSMRGLLKQEWNKGTIFSFLPVPLTLTTNPKLLEEILIANDVSREKINRCLKENRIFETLINKQLETDSTSVNQVVTIYQLESMERRIEEGGFISCSLSLITGKEIKVSREQYSRSLRHVIKCIDEYPYNKIVIASEKDHVYLPELNCWCKGKDWMIQMDMKGMRYCNEDVMVRAAYLALEQCLRKIPPVRKQPEKVKEVLFEMIEKLDNND